MKKLILPIGIPVVLVLALKLWLVPDIEAVGIGILAAAGFFVGLIINMKLFPETKKDTAEEKSTKF